LIGGASTKQEFAMRHRILIGVLTLLLAFGITAQTEPSTNPSTQPSVSPQAQAILDQMDKAYREVKALNLTGKLSLDFDAGGDQKKDSVEFTASFVAPNKFRHEIKGDTLIVSTGEKVYAYAPGPNEYVVVDAPKDRVTPKDMPDSIVDLLASQNPVLLMAIAQNPTGPLIDGGGKVEQVDDVKLDGTSFKALAFTKDERGYRVLMDPSTNFIRQIQIDRKDELKNHGVEDVKSALITLDYSANKAEAPAAELFAWTPPKDATVAKEPQPDDAGADAKALEGKPAPDFKLTAIDGSTVSLADLKGSVAVLDFWATWCGPCVASLPSLAQLNTELSPKGVKIYALNQQEEKATVQKFLLTQKLDLPVLLDSAGDAGKKYMANAIPETVVVGKDGIIKKVFVGFGGDETPLKQAIEAEMKK
jgi:thiol-disulfide isomerase/thioredoxin/outer membrane lipoprotein-sorting protein